MLNPVSDPSSYEPASLCKAKTALPGQFFPKSHTCTMLTRKDQDCMPPLSITEASGSWLRTGISPCDRSTSTTLKYGGYTNVVPSRRFRPLLLCGHSVSNYLEYSIVPGIPCLHFRLHLPRRTLRQRPASFGSTF